MAGAIYVPVQAVAGVVAGCSRAARLLRAAVHGYATLELSGAWQTPLDDEATFGWLLEVIIAGLTTGSRPVI